MILDYWSKSNKLITVDNFLAIQCIYVFDHHFHSILDYSVTMSLCFNHKVDMGLPSSKLTYRVAILKSTTNVNVFPIAKKMCRFPASQLVIVYRTVSSSSLFFPNRKPQEKLCTCRQVLSNQPFIWEMVQLRNGASSRSKPCPWVSRCLCSMPALEMTFGCQRQRCFWEC